MKRARPSEDTFNPVYPYDTETGPPTVPFLTPPFVSPNGFQESPPGVLSLRVSEPLDTSHGMLALKMGSGLTLDKAGNLTSQNVTTVTQPLKKTKSNISLDTSAPLTITSGALTVATTAPLIVTSGALSVQSQAPLTVQDSKLSIATKGPITVSDGKLALQTSAPLSGSDSDTLTVTASPPLTTAMGSLGINMEDPIYVNNGKIGIKISGPLQVAQNSDTLTVVTGPGVTVEQNSLRTKVAGAIGYDSSNNMEIKTGGGMRINNNLLILDVDYPFDAQTKLRLKLGQGPLYINASHNLDINYNRGLYLFNASNNTKKLEVSIKKSSGLNFDNTAIAINAGKGLEFDTNTSESPDINPIKTKIGSGIDYNENGAMITKLGAGLSFDNSGAITIGNKNDDKLTLWTTPDPSPNCRIHSDNDCKFTLVLTKCGSQVLATVAALAVSGDLSSMTGTVASVSIFLRFDQNGVLMENSSLKKHYWNFRNGNSTNANPYTNAVGFMPNLLAYPKTQSQTAKNNIVSQVYLHGDKTKPMILTITLNGTSESTETSEVSTYSMSFTWSWESGKYTTETFATNSYTFSYIAQE
ncbi:fiber [Human mastadenovirus C]|uniref:Fiber protein n=9 Tax=Human mastadenovirus C TaxID=129951 RepID=Q910N0_ADE02|nr:fiber [Human mastadenovirus C]WEG78050.1 fiber [Human adenovirus 2]AFS50573.1 fiber [Human mastadenovirus C]AGT77092.1 fiber [Human mastadenovirus C]AZR66232.1 fiber [Human mastadenovirus C]